MISAKITIFPFILYLILELKSLNGCSFNGRWVANTPAVPPLRNVDRVSGATWTQVHGVMTRPAAPPLTKRKVVLVGWHVASRYPVIPLVGQIKY